MAELHGVWQSWMGFGRAAWVLAELHGFWQSCIGFDRAGWGLAELDGVWHRQSGNRFTHIRSWRLTTLFGAVRGRCC